MKTMKKLLILSLLALSSAYSFGARPIAEKFAVYRHIPTLHTLAINSLAKDSNIIIRFLANETPKQFVQKEVPQNVEKYALNFIINPEDTDPSEAIKQQLYYKKPLSSDDYSELFIKALKICTLNVREGIIEDILNYADFTMESLEYLVSRTLGMQEQGKLGLKFLLRSAVNKTLPQDLAILPAFAAVLSETDTDTAHMILGQSFTPLDVAVLSGLTDLVKEKAAKASTETLKSVLCLANGTNSTESIPLLEQALSSRQS